MPSFAEARETLLNGNTLSWGTFGGHKRGTIRLRQPGQRRLLAYLLAAGMEKLSKQRKKYVPSMR